MDEEDIFPDGKKERFESDDNYLIVASKTGIDGLDQRVYLRNNWNKICTMFARILILCGIHGLSDGSIKRDDEKDLTYIYENMDKGIKDKTAKDQ